MPAETGLVTAEELLAWPDDGMRHELIRGELRTMSPAGARHGKAAMRVGMLLAVHVREHGLGEVAAAETGFWLSRDPDTVRAPDAAFIARERADQVGDAAGYWPIAPDLAVEVVSPNDTFTEVHEQALEWLSAGTRMVVVLDPATRRVTLYEPGPRSTPLSPDDVVDLGAVVPGFAVAAGELLPS